MDATAEWPKRARRNRLAIDFACCVTSTSIISFVLSEFRFRYTRFFREVTEVSEFWKIPENSPKYDRSMPKIAIVEFGAVQKRVNLVDLEKYRKLTLQLSSSELRTDLLKFGSPTNPRLPIPWVKEKLCARRTCS